MRRHRHSYVASGERVEVNVELDKETAYNEIHMSRTVDPQPRSERDHHHYRRHNLRIKEGGQKRCVPLPRAAVTVLRRCHQHHVPRPRIPTTSFRLPNASNSRASAPRPASPHLSRGLTRGRVSMTVRRSAINAVRSARRRGRRGSLGAEFGAHVRARAGLCSVAVGGDAVCQAVKESLALAFQSTRSAA